MTDRERVEEWAKCNAYTLIIMSTLFVVTWLVFTTGFWIWVWV